MNQVGPSAGGPPSGGPALGGPPPGETTPPPYGQGGPKPGDGYGGPPLQQPAYGAPLPPQPGYGYAQPAYGYAPPPPQAARTLRMFLVLCIPAHASQRPVYTPMTRLACRCSGGDCGDGGAADSSGQADERLLAVPGDD